jgi:hypothetical protein
MIVLTSFDRFLNLILFDRTCWRAQIPPYSSSDSLLELLDDAGVRLRLPTYEPREQPSWNDGEEDSGLDISVSESELLASDSMRDDEELRLSSARRPRCLTIFLCQWHDQYRKREQATYGARER